MSDESLLTIVEVAKKLQFSTKSVRRWIKQGRFGPKPIKFGNKLRFPRGEVIDWIQHGCPDRAQWAEKQKMNEHFGTRPARVA